MASVAADNVLAALRGEEPPELRQPPGPAPLAAEVEAGTRFVIDGSRPSGIA